MIQKAKRDIVEKPRSDFSASYLVQFSPVELQPARATVIQAAKLLAEEAEASKKPGNNRP